MARKRDESRASEASRLYHAEGMTRDEVAKQLGVRGTTVSRWLDNPRPRGPRPRADVSDKLIIELREREGLGWAEIGRRVHMSRRGVHNRYLAITGQQRPERVKSGPNPMLGPATDPLGYYDRDLHLLTEPREADDDDD